MSTNPENLAKIGLVGSELLISLCSMRSLKKMKDEDDDKERK